MWVEKTKTGYKLVERYTDVFGVERKASVSFKSKGDRRKAQEALFERIGGLVSKDARFRPKLDFGSLCEKYVDWERSNYKPQTVYCTIKRMETLKALIGADYAVSDFTAKYIRDCLKKERRGREVTATTYNERLRRFKALMRWAYREAILDDISYVDRLQGEKECRREKLMNKYLESDELKAVIDAMTVPKWRTLTQFLALSGLRIGEALALNVSDIHDGVIDVNKTYSLQLQRISSTKTAASERTVFIQDELKPVIKKAKELSRKSKLFPYDYDAYAKYLRETTEKVTGKKLSPHALRHTHVALLAENGAALEAISRRVGHADSKVTSDIYMHVTKKIREKDDAFFKNIRIF